MFIVFSFSGFVVNSQDLIITGVFDGPLTGGSPKVLEMYAINDIADLSLYTVQNQTNANITWGSDFALSGAATAGDFIYVVNTGQTADFNTYFANSITPLESSVVNLNGDDRLAISYAGGIVDIFGEENVDGTGTGWEWLDGWAYRSTVGTLPATAFIEGNWTYSGINVTDGETDNASAATPFTIGTFTMGGPVIEVDWCNLQWPDVATVNTDVTFDVYARVFEAGVTEAAGQGADIECWIGYSTSDTDPSTWTDWVVASYGSDQGNNDEYTVALSFPTAGTYYYASRFSLESGPYTYGGYNVGGGNIWDGTTNVSGVATVNDIPGSTCAAALSYANINDAEQINAIDATTRELWYTVTLDQTYVDVQFSTCGSVYDTRLYIYDACGGTLLDSNDDDYSGLCSTNAQSVINNASLLAGTYYVLITPYDGTEDISDPTTGLLVTGSNCEVPNTVVANNITATSADVEWLASVIGETGWNIKVHEAVAIDPTAVDGDIVANDAVSTTPLYTLSTLSENTDYYVYIQSDCGSDWVGFMFSTPLACPVPTNLVADITGINALLSWDELGQTDWVLEVSTTPLTDPTAEVGDILNDEAVTGAAGEYNLMGLAPEVTYYWYVQSTCGSAWSAEGEFYIGYCIPNPSSVDGSGITNVTFGQVAVVNNPTGTEAGNYGDYSAMIGDAAQSTDLTVSITYETSYTYGTKIWIDWNNDLTFDEVTELVYTGLSAVSNPTTLDAIFNIPLATPLGNYRMRIGGTDTDAGPSSACYSGSYGSFEDYTLEVTAAPSCLTPNTLFADAVIADAANLNWTEAGTATGWNLKVTTSSTFDPSTDAGEVFEGAATGNPHSLSGLTASTTYYFYVQADCLSTWSTAGSFTTTDLFVNLPISEDFETGLGNVVLVNGTQTNYWMNGTLASQTGDAIYVTDNGVDNQYTITTISTSHAYIPIDFAGATNVSLNFDWICQGEGTQWDYLRVYLVPDTESIDAGTLISTGYQIGATYYFEQSTLQNESIDLTAAEITQDQMRLVFTWKNDGSGGTTPPASVDNIMLEEITCATPNTVVANNVTATTADIEWIASVLGETTWNIKVASYTIDPTIADGDIIANGAVATTPLQALTGLDAGTDYYVYVQSDCGSDWTAEYMFTTLASCLEPNTLFVDNIATTSANLNWTEAGTAAAWNLKISTISIDPATGTPDFFEGAATGNPEILSGLTAGTTYYWYVQADCGGSTSVWSTEGMFTTDCDIVGAYPYFESFEDTNMPNCWLVYNEDADAKEFVINTSITAQDGSQSVSVGYNGSGNDDWLVSPQFNVINDNLVLEFYARSNSTSFFESFNVLVSTTGTATGDFTIVLDNVVDAPNAWTKYTYKLADFGIVATDQINIAIQCVSSDELTFAVDAFKVREASSEKEILTFTHINETGTAAIDNGLFTVELEVANGTVITTLVPTITVSTNASISPLSGVAQDFTGSDVTPIVYTVTAEDGTTQDWDVTVTESMTLSSDNDILTFTFPEETGVAIFDAGAHTVAIEVNWLANVADLTPTITTSLLSTINPLTGVAQDFTAPFVYTVTAEDLTPQDWTVTVTQEATPAGVTCATAFDYGLINDAAITSTLAADEAIWYTFTLDQAYANVVVSACGSDFDTRLGVYADCGDFDGGFGSVIGYDPAGTIGWDDDGCPGTIGDTYASTIDLGTLSAGTYYAVLYGYSAGSNGNTRFEVTGSDCAAPNTIATDNLTATTTDITWIASDLGETEWNIKVNVTVAIDPTAVDGDIVANDAVSTTPIYNLPTLTAETDYYVYVQSDCGSDWVEFMFTTPSACPTPTGLDALVLGTNDATLTWDELGTTDWVLEVSTTPLTDPATESGDILDDQSIVGAVGTYDISGLTAQTTYYWYVQSACGSAWSAEGMFTTACDAIVALPWFEGFESATFAPDCWTNNNWTQSTYGTAHTGVEFAYSNLLGAELTTPAIELPATGNYIFSYWYAAEDSGNAQDADVLLSTDGVLFDVTLETITGHTDEAYQQTTIDLTPYLGQTIWVKFVGQSGTGGLSYGIAVDDVEVREMSDENDILTWSFPQQTTTPVVIDDMSHTVGIEVDNGTNLATLTPTFTVSPFATVDIASDVENDFSTNPTMYTVTSEMGTAQVWRINVTEATLNPQIATIDTNSDVADINVCLGVDEATAIAGLVTEITITDSDAVDHLVTVTWTIDTYDGMTAADYDATGTFVLPLGVDQTDPATTLEVYAVVTVNELPVVTCPATIPMTTDAGVTTLTGATPAGGVYTGTNVTGDQFDPTGLAIGLYTITYTYTDPTTGCVNSCDFDIDIITDIETVSIEGINVYPNPNNGVFTIDFNNIEGDVTYQIYDTKGSIIVVEDISANGNTVKEVSLDLVPGVYYVKVVTTAKTIIEKLIVQ